MLMNVDNNKMDYLFPQIEVFRIRVECGFAASGEGDDNSSDQMPEIDGENEDIEW